MLLAVALQALGIVLIVAGCALAFGLIGFLVASGAVAFAVGYELERKRA